MQLLIIRHAQAEKREDWSDLGSPDSLRPLTKKGLSRFADAISGLNRFIPKIDHIYSSQFTRAMQTGEMLHGHYKGSDFSTIRELNPEGEYNKIAKMLSQYSEEQTVAIVGHQPDLSALTSSLLGSHKDLLIRYKKGGASLISYIDGSAQLQWIMTQRQLSYLSSI